MKHIAWATLALITVVASAQREPRQKYSIEQAISDRAQLHTIAFSGLAFLTGDYGASTFIPPGKVCDYFGFQYMRDIDSQQKGHNPVFLNRVAANVMKTLTTDQKKLFQDLATEQEPKLEALARMRLPLIKAFWREQTGDLPAKSKGLDETAVTQYVGDIFAADGELSYRRAQVNGQIAKSLSPEQKSFFASMKFGDFGTWPDLDHREQMRGDVPRGKPKMWTVAYMTYVSEWYSWYAGSLEADTYFCPERHGTYFGGFYMKDMPAMGKRDFDISMTVTGDSGQGFLEVLNEDQRRLITEIIPAQKNDIKETVTVRRQISSELRKFLVGETPDRKKVLDLCRHYGELDGRMSWRYTVAFAKVKKTLTSAQMGSLVKLRNLSGYTSAPAYLYSDAMKELPDLGNTDRFFFTVSKNQQVGGNR